MARYHEHPNVSTASSLISSLSKERYPLDTIMGIYKALDPSRQAPNVFLFSSIFKTCLDYGQPHQALSVHHDMKQHSVLPDKGCFITLTLLFAATGDTSLGKDLLELLRKNAKLMNAGVVECTHIIKGFFRNSHIHEAVSVLDVMDQVGINPDLKLYTIFFKACADMKALGVGNYVRTQMERKGLKGDIILNTSLLNMYVKCADYQSVIALWKTMHHTSKLDTITWNTMISAQLKQHNLKHALELYEEMIRAKVEPTEATYTTLLSGCADNNDLVKGEEIYQHILKHGVQPTVRISNALLSLYGKSGKLTEAMNIFRTMQISNQANVVTWTATISAYISSKQYWEALKMFDQMQQAGIYPNEVSYVCAFIACGQVVGVTKGEKLKLQLLNSGLKLTMDLKNALLNFYAKCSKLSVVQSMFDQMCQENEVNIDTWNAVLGAYAQTGNYEATFRLFQEMQQQFVKPNDVTFTALLNACSHTGHVEKAFSILQEMKTIYGIPPNTTHYNCVVDAIGRAGKLEDAEKFIRMIPQPDIVSWVSLLSACRWHGDIKRAELAANEALKFDDKHAPVYVLLSNIYAMANRVSDVERIRLKMKNLGIKKIPGRTWIEIDGEVHTFYVEDKNHPQKEKIYAKLQALDKQMKEAGFQPNVSFDMHDETVEEKEWHLCHHRYITMYITY